MLRTITIVLLVAPALLLGQPVDTAWAREVGASGFFSFAADLHADADGNVWVCGRGRDGDKADEDLVVARFNAWGDTVWVRFLDGGHAVSSDDIAHALAVDSAGNVFVAGALDAPGDSGLDMVVAKYAPDGDLLWSWVSGYQDDDLLFDIAVGNGRVYACGTVDDPVNWLTAFSMLRLDPADGSVLWRRDSVVDPDAFGKARTPRKRAGRDRYPEWFEEWWDYDNAATAIAIAPDDGSVVATGFGLHYNREYQFFTIKRDQDGNRLWADVRGRTLSYYDDAAFAIAISDQGQVYVAGMGEADAPYYDWLVVRYASNGGFLNRYTLNSPWDGDEWATAITLDDDDPQHVYVTGFLQYAPANGDERIVTQKLTGAFVAQWGNAGAQYQQNAGNHPDIAYDISYAEGHVYVTGLSGPTGRDLVLLCYDTLSVTGGDPKVEKWVTTLHGAGASVECGSMVFAVDSNHIYVAGERGYGNYPQTDSMAMTAFRFFHPRRDVAPDSLLAPAPEVLYGERIAPVVRVHNPGNDRSSFEVRLHIEGAPGYHDTVVVTNLLPGETAFAVFDTWTAGPMETLAIVAVTALASDDEPANDTLRGTVIVGGIVDLAVAEIVAPAGALDTLQPAVPAARFENRGDVPSGFTAWLFLLDPDEEERYRESVEVAALAVGADTVVEFPSWAGSGTTGRWTAACSLALDDGDPANDTLAAEFRIEAAVTWPPGWVEVAPIPAMVGNRRDMPHRGAWLAVGPGPGGEPAIYATKGNKLQSFYRHNPQADEWTQLTDAPLDPTRGRPLRQGARGISDGDNSIYMVHGNNTLAFWRYDIAANTWTALTDVPEGPSRKRVKGGGDMLYIEQGGVGYVYLLKGDRDEFWRYNTGTGSWSQLATPPAGIRNRWKRDSWLAFDGEDAIYAHKANYFDRGTLTHELWSYDVAGDFWSVSDTLAGMPLSGLEGGRIKRKKAKDGGAGAYDNGAIYALKGGNTQQFWLYNVAGDSWTASDTVPTFSPTTGKRRRVNGGGDLVNYSPGAFFALKGNKTVEFWRYVVPAGMTALRPERGGVMAGGSGRPVGISISPSLVTGNSATLRYSLPKAGPAAVTVYDVSGRSVLSTRSPGHLATGSLPLDLRALSSGVYLVKVEAGDFSASQKLVVQK